MRDGMVDELVSVGCLKTPRPVVRGLTVGDIYGQTSSSTACSRAATRSRSVPTRRNSWMKPKRRSRTCCLLFNAASFYTSRTRHTTTQVPALYNKIYDGFRAFNRRGMSDGKKALAIRPLS